MLSKSRNALADIVQRERGNYFPSFQGTCQEAAERIDLIVLRSRGVLGTFFKTYGSPDAGDSSTNIQNLQASIKGDFETEEKQHNTDMKSWKTFSGYVDKAKVNEMPLRTVLDLEYSMVSDKSSPVALVIIPPPARDTALLNIYHKLYEQVSSIIFSVDDPKTAQCCSVCADPALDSSILLLDDGNTTLMQAFTKARTSLLAIFVSFGLVREPLGLAAWSSFGPNGRNVWWVLHCYLSQTSDGDMWAKIKMAVHTAKGQKHKI